MLIGIDGAPIQRLDQTQVMGPNGRWVNVRGYWKQCIWRVGLVMAWIVTVGIGMGMLYSYGATPGGQTAGPERWPGDSAIPAGVDKHRLVMFVHPRCPCSRASLRELDRLMIHLPEAAVVTVAAVYPPGIGPVPSENGLLQQASAIHGVRVFTDYQATEAQRFGAQTSGHVVAYDRQGRLVFRGGITSARGHEGDSLGRDMLIQALWQDDHEAAQAAVFGCSLQ